MTCGQFSTVFIGLREIRERSRRTTGEENSTKSRISRSGVDEVDCSPDYAEAAAKQDERKNETTMLHCSKCKSDVLAIKQATGLEGFIATLTNTRKYRCYLCKYEFRARDRREISRPAHGRKAAGVRVPV
jgi:hypothetical protein